MKKIICITQLLVLMVCTSCHAQKLMQTQADASKLVEQKEQFVGKPLKALLNEINLPIKAYTASRWTGPYGALVFMFVPYDSAMKRDNEGRLALRIRMTVKEAFEWDNRARKADEQHLWLSEDQKKYENLTIANIGISGEDRR